MEWIADIHSPTDDHLVTGGRKGYTFVKQYDSKPHTKCEVIQQSRKDGVTDTHLTEDGFEDWLKTDAAEQASRASGLSLLLCGRQGPVDLRKIPVDLKKLPLLQTHFKRFASVFNIHHHVRRVIEREKTYLSSAFSPGPSKPQDPLRSGTSRCCSRCFAQHHGHKGKIVYTGLFRSSILDSEPNDEPKAEPDAQPIAFTSTSSLSTNPASALPELASCGMMLGCTNDDMPRVSRMVRDTPQSWRNHPMLVPLIFVEVQSRRLRHLVDNVTDDAVAISVKAKKLSASSSNKLPRALVKKTTDVRVRGSIIQEDLSRASRQLSNIISHCESLLDTNSTLGKLMEQTYEDGTVTQTFLNRLKELNTDYQDLIADCKINSDQAALFLDVSSNEKASGLAEASMTLALVAMAYLPMSTLATILAMPIIDFSVTWRDLNNHVVPHGTTAVSIYLVYYIMMVVILTLVTMELWWYWRNHDAKPVWKRSITLIFISLMVGFLRRLWEAIGKALKWLIPRLDNKNEGERMTGLPT